MLGGIPGLIHAWYIILKYPDAHDDNYRYTYPGDRRDSERGVFTYYFVGPSPSSQDGRSAQNQQHHDHQQYFQPQSYGSTASNNPGQSFPANDDAAGPTDAGNDGVPPTYDQAIKGDHKVQSRD